MPCWDKLQWYNVMSLFVLASNWQKIGLENISLMLIPRRNIVDGRQLVYDKFREEKEYTHLLSLDDDVAFQLSDIRRLLEDDKDFVSGMYKWRREPRLVNAHVDNKPIVYEKVKNSGLIKVTSCSLGFALMSRKIPEKMGEYKFWRKVGAEQDVNFTKALVENGIDLWLDTRVLAVHAGEILIGEELKIV